MSILSDLLVGKSESMNQQGSQTQTQRQRVNPRMAMAMDLANRGILGQLAQPPETAISIPQQQGISNLQAGLPAMGANFGIGGTMAERLGGRPIAPVQTSLGTAQPGAMLPGGSGQQFGLQSRAQMGLPARTDYFPFTPSAEEVAALGLPSVRPGSKQGQKLAKREEKLTNRIENRQAAGKGTAKAEGKLARVQSKQRRTAERQNY